MHTKEPFSPQGIDVQKCITGAESVAVFQEAEKHLPADQCTLDDMKSALVLVGALEAQEAAIAFRNHLVATGIFEPVAQLARTNANPIEGVVYKRISVAA